jgi:hypothetical protein
MAEREISRYYNKGLIIDTNLLLLLVVGLYDRNFINKFKRVSAYNIEDFETLRKFTSKFKIIIITPHILAELSNLSFNIEGKRLKKYFYFFSNILYPYKEVYLHKNILLNLELAGKIGITDCGIIETAKRHKCLAITDDLNVYLHMCYLNLPAVNFNHLKS